MTSNFVLQKSLFLNIIIDQMFADKDPGTFDRPIFGQFCSVAFFVLCTLIVLSEQFVLNVATFLLELGGAVQLLGVLRVLLDPENMMTALTNVSSQY